jgi:low affinity Fe/Cu permease
MARKMKNQSTSGFRKHFETFCNHMTKATGSPAAVIVAFSVILVWAVTGPLFHFSDTWQLVINTGTTIITFIMVFIIQHSQNKDTVAMHIKLNELIAANGRASNRVVNIEDLTENELQTLKKFYITLSELAQKDKDIFTSHSIDEAHANSRSKKTALKKQTDE